MGLPAVGLIGSRESLAPLKHRQGNEKKGLGLRRTEESVAVFSGISLADSVFAFSCVRQTRENLNISGRTTGLGRFNRHSSCMFGMLPATSVLLEG